MRCVAGAGLLALAGCNQIFALTPTKEFDAAVDAVPDMHARLTWQVATVLPAGGPDPTIAFPPIAPAPRIRIATLDGELETAAYSPDDGRIAFPQRYGGSPWRLEYTLTDNIPREVQWSPEDEVGHLTVPVIGRLDRQPAPIDGGYRITPAGVPGYTFPRVLTTGLWTDGRVTTPPAGATVDYPFFDAVSLSGAKGRPDHDLGDRAYLVDYISEPGSLCRVAVGSVALQSAAIAPGALTVAVPETNWDTARKPVTSDEIALPFLLRLATALDKLHTLIEGTAMFGFAPTTSMPGLLGSLPTAALPVPVMLTLLQCPYSVHPLPAAAQPARLERAQFPAILHIQLVDGRQVLGVNLNSGMETVIATDQVVAFDVAFPAAIPTRMMLTTPASGTVDLAGDAEQVAVGSAAGAFTLAFTPETGVDVRADYYEVRLRRLNAGALTIERIYTVTAPSVRIDGALLVPGALYVFEIRSYRGHPKASVGDFAPVSYPYGSAIVYTRTFRAS